ncbi:hypothetical protein [Brucella gallinifaecis]|uniref:hypothetical protein n=1 Tax=Brucella gallinifaecis TaxID=215590 RepID=UPI00235F0B08|nr:hypothetical protein [Brucella gallinifaecis]
MGVPLAGFSFPGHFIAIPHAEEQHGPLSPPLLMLSLHKPPYLLDLKETYKKTRAQNFL